LSDKTHKSLADRVKFRVDKYNVAKALKEKESKQKLYAARKVTQLLKTEGWKILLEDLELQVDQLKNKLTDINSFRIWKTTQIKSLIKAKAAIIVLMKKHQMKSTLKLLKE